MTSLVHISFIEAKFIYYKTVDFKCSIPMDFDKCIYTSLEPLLKLRHKFLLLQRDCILSQPLNRFSLSSLEIN